MAEDQHSVSEATKMTKETERLKKELAQVTNDLNLSGDDVTHLEGSNVKLLASRDCLQVDLNTSKLKVVELTREIK